MAADALSDKILFEAAQVAVKTLSSLDDRNKLRLYAHYKQAKGGAVQGSRPPVFEQIARAKWDAWSALQDMSKQDAMREYCKLADEFVPGWRDRLVQQTGTSEGQARNARSDGTSSAPASGASDEALFAAAQAAVKTLSSLDNRNKLRLYAHYKQAKEGPVKGSRPGVFEQVARAKWDAWSTLQNMSKHDAMREYCKLADEFVPGWRDRLVQQTGNSEGQASHVGPDDTSSAPASGASDEALFAAAQAAVKTLSSLDNRNKLRLYAHYKQAKEGPVKGSRPGVFEQVARAKWDAWSTLQNMSKQDAMREYCKLADEFVPGWRDRLVQQTGTSEGQARNARSDGTSSAPASGASDEALFAAAQAAVKTLSSLDNRNQLRLYAHYKQAKVGPVKGSRPGVFEQVARAKWDAWSTLQNTSKQDAMREYCKLADEFVPGWRDRLVQQTGTSEGQARNARSDGTSNAPASGASDEALFAGAQAAVKTLSSLDNRNKLRLFAHYKQAKEGPVKGSRPGVFEQVARAKWDAWSALQNMSKQDAMREYCKLADEFVPGWRDRLVQQTGNSEGQASHVGPDDTSSAPASGASDEALFAAAQAAVKTLSSLDNRNQLRLYAHYKQAKVGPVKGSRPGVFEQVARAKWDAWSALQDMSKQDAMREYCKLADEFVPGWRDRLVQQTGTSEGQARNARPEYTSSAPASGASDEVLFAAAAQAAVKTLSSLDSRNKLRLYAHYKQAKEGPAKGSRPGVFEKVARARWDAWSALHNMSKQDAMREYCKLADEFVPGWQDRLVQQTGNSDGQTSYARPDDASRAPASGAGDEALFAGAQAAVKTLSSLDNRNQLRLYAHYKQAKEGPVKGSRPGVFEQVARAKWDAWSTLQNMSKQDAMREYCKLADEFVPGWRDRLVQQTVTLEGQASYARPDGTSSAPASGASDEALFAAAQAAVKTLSFLDNRNKLRLYAHYKQAKEGPVKGSRPGVFDQVARAKWDAWSTLQDMSKQDAMREYCKLADEFVPGWRQKVTSKSESSLVPFTSSLLVLDTFLRQLLWLLL